MLPHYLYTTSGAPTVRLVLVFRPDPTDPYFRGLEDHVF